MGRLFESPADLVGNITAGDLLSSANGVLLRALEPVKPESFKEEYRAAVAGQFYLQVFGDVDEIVFGWHRADDIEWPLRKVQMVDVDD